MQITTLKNIIIHKISEINDVSFLEAVNKIIDVKKETEILVLDDIIKEEISKSKEEINNGLFIEDEKLNADINRWLQEK